MCLLKKEKKKEVGDTFTAVSHMKVRNASTAVSHDRNCVYNI